MRKLFSLFCILFFSITVDAQVKGVLERAKQRAKDKANQKVNNTADNAVDSVFSKTEKTVTDVLTGSHRDTSINNESNKSNSGSVSFKAYSKYDFVPGEKVIGFEDFSTGSVGDFPAGWNTNGAGEIVTIDGMPGRWLWLTRPGVFLPEFTDNYPDDFTFEFDLLHGTPTSGGTLSFLLAQLENFDALQGWNTSSNTFRVGFYHTSSGQKTGSVSTEIRKNASSNVSNQVETELMSDANNPVHISIWRQKERVRVYINEQKIWDIPRAISTEAKLNAIFFPIIHADENLRHYVGNLRLAVGAPDTRKKMLEQNKWVTHGILFDVNSAAIKPQSYGTLKEMANMLKEHSDLKVMIVGHTDADGNDASNLELSKKKAASVKVALAKEFGIDENRMETYGNGETEPIDNKDTPAGKANNRRVEFIKLSLL